MLGALWAGRVAVYSNGPLPDGAIGAPAAAQVAALRDTILVVAAALIALALGPRPSASGRWALGAGRWALGAGRWAQAYTSTRRAPCAGSSPLTGGRPGSTSSRDCPPRSGGSEPRLSPATAGKQKELTVNDTRQRGPILVTGATGQQGVRSPGTCSPAAGACGRWCATQASRRRWLWRGRVPSWCMATSTTVPRSTGRSKASTASSACRHRSRSGHRRRDTPGTGAGRCRGVCRCAALRLLLGRRCRAQHRHPALREQMAGRAAYSAAGPARDDHAAGFFMDNFAEPWARPPGSWAARSFSRCDLTSRSR